MLTVNAIIQNPFWLQIYLREKLSIDDTLVLKTEKEIIDILKLNDLRECENKLVVMFKRENFNFIKFKIRMIIKNNIIKELQQYIQVINKELSDEKSFNDKKGLLE